MRFVLTPVIFILSCLIATIAHADKQRVQFYKCFGNEQKLIVEGRVIEQSGSAVATPSDSIIKNIYRKVRQLLNDEQENVAIALKVDDVVRSVVSDEEGYFSLELENSTFMTPGYHTLTSRLASGEVDTCKLIVFPAENTVGIISDFDDTVIISEVTDKDKLFVNSFTKNYTQRVVVAGTPQFFQILMNENTFPEYAPVFFVTGSPRQIQESIDKFLDLNGFPPRVVITKKISGNERDPLFDQYEYKLEKIKRLLGIFPGMKFYLVGDDGEKDPEVYNAIAKQFPERILATWIHQVNPDLMRARFPNQKLFEQNPKK